jgi:hypothetical protein
MGRWRLTQKHYLMVQGCEWEYKEITDSGRQVKKVFPVPMYLDPDDRSDHNYPGEIIVCDGVGALPRDHIFTGRPGPDMAPIDEDAQAKSDAEAARWVHPIESVDTDGNDTSAANGIMKELAALVTSQRPSGYVPKEDFDELKAQVAALTAALTTKTHERRA